VYLKRLDLLGFKSFAIKTAVHFSSGITAIVGPNGCGKTNILDSLRWVLGEQKVTLLRGSKMEEVIFNGTSEMKPLGMSEVTLTLVNNRGVLPTEYTEVQVTRRLFRSGESEYLLNKVPCRLKDIHELFFDTGMGAHSYSVIQQDMIEAVISDKAEERRFLFEEAAGITKYKQRKRAALRKLESTEGDLLRLKDIYSEVQTQVRSLNRQQKKASRYQMISQEIKDWELYLGSRRIKQIERERRELQAQLDDLSTRRANKETALSKIASMLEADRKEQVDLEHELTGIGNEIYQISERAHSLEREVTILVEKRSNARKLIERNQQEIQALHNRRQILGEQTKEAEIELEEQRAQVEQLNVELEKAQSLQAEADRQLLAARSSKEAENKTLIELEGKLSSGKTEEDNLRQQEEEFSERIADLTRQLENASEQKIEISTLLKTADERLEELKRQKAEAETERHNLLKQIEDAVEQSESLALEISNTGAAIEACEARKSLLEDMIVHFEGYSSGVVSVMEMNDRWPGIVGTVADKFTPDDGYAIAVEAALGELAGYLICRDRRTAEEIVAHLKQEKQGRIGIVVPDSGAFNPVVKRPEINAEGFIGWLDNYVSADTDLKPLMQAILSRVAVFDSSVNPDQILSHLPYGFSAVSADGTVYRQNVISGGSEDTLPLFRRREKLSEQESQIEELSKTLTSLKHDKDQLAASQAADRAASVQLAAKIESLAEEVAEAADERTALQYKLTSLTEESTRLEREKKQANDRLEQIRNRQYSLKLDFNQLANRKENLVRGMNQTDDDLQSLEDHAGQAMEQLSRIQIQTVESRSRSEQIESKIRHTNELRQEISNTATAKETEITQAETDIETCGQRITELETELKQVFSSRSEANERQGSLRTTQADILNRVDDRETQLKTIRSERESIADQSHQMEMRVNTLRSEITSLTERINDEYDLDIGSYEANRPDENMDDEQARANLRELKERLKNFGAVNLLALEEYQTAVERESFLKEQLDDLTQAKDDLQSTITKINRTARQLFQETFTQVKTNFQKLFVDLFTGGEADIMLEDPSDPLESDIHIIARPRGKKLLSITMMSGGERALTAIALLFSLYLVKPSPFCILDEIDAPLDDANCKRFLNIIDRFSDRTQFIIITHNKITMEKAQNLYGVTMEKAGVSKLVAVKFTDIAEGESSEQVVASPNEEEIASLREGIAADIPSPEPETEVAPRSEPDIPDNIAERLNANVTISDESDEEDQA